MNYIIKRALNDILSFNVVLSLEVATGHSYCAKAWPFWSYRENEIFVLESFSLLMGIDKTKCIW